MSESGRKKEKKDKERDKSSVYEKDKDEKKKKDKKEKKDKDKKNKKGKDSRRNSPSPDRQAYLQFQEQFSQMQTIGKTAVSTAVRNVELKLASAREFK